MEDLFFILVWIGMWVFLKDWEAVGFTVDCRNFVQRSQDAGKASINVWPDLVKLF